MILQDLLKMGCEALPKREAEELLAFLLHMKPLELYLHFKEPCGDDTLSLYQGLIKKRLIGEPLAYILGFVPFLKCDIHVNRCVLIPRPETELLAATIIKELKNEKEKTLLDLCTGSGCLGIAIKKECPGLNVILSDISKEALKIAKENASLAGVTVTILHGDLLSPFKGAADYVVANPPYVSEEEYRHLPEEIRSFEPKGALLAGDGLLFYRRLAKDLPFHLKKGSKIWLEIGKDQGPSVKKIFSSLSKKEGQIDKDFSGHDRFFSLVME